MTGTLDARPYAPGLEGILAGETALSYIDGANGRLLYRGYRIADLVERGTFAQVAELLWTGSWPAHVFLPPEPVPHAVLVALRDLPRDAHPMDALRTAVSVYAAGQRRDGRPRSNKLDCSLPSPPQRWRPSPVFGMARSPSTQTPHSRLPQGSCSSSRDRSPNGPRRGPWMPTSSWRPSTASMPPPSPPGSSPPPAPTWAAPCAGRSAP